MKRPPACNDKDTSWMVDPLFNTRGRMKTITTGGSQWNVAETAEVKGQLAQSQNLLQYVTDLKSSVTQV